jgi:2-C-methyl-D-erythritol 4-phosphate cytidylyltransferase
MSGDEIPALGSMRGGGVAAVIPAAGEGRRMATPVEKQFLPLRGLPILSHTVKVFQSCLDIQAIVLVVPEPRTQWVWEEVVRKNEFGKVMAVVPGGTTRQESVRRGLDVLGEGWEVVVIHDGARPLVLPETVSLVVEGARRHGACVVAIPVRDTIKEVDDQGFVTRTVPRQGLWSVQTPQGFRQRIITEAHLLAEKDGFEATDDASLVERMGLKVKVVMGSQENLKITTPEDLALAEEILARRERASK